ncbi:MAG: ribosomal protein S18-alanine N-acetyltransferase [archaeon]|nr:ribosomal protein S18-alanine N-acetyltransferase [archaeon]
MSNNYIVVRQFLSSDIKRVMEIERASIKEITPLSHLSRYYEIPPWGFIVAEIDGIVIGYIVTNIKDVNGRKEGHVLAIAVDPAYSRKGVGTQLLSNMEKILKDMGIDEIGLEVKVSNINARRFYKHLGFKESRILKGYYRMRGYTEDAVLMVKRLF